MNSVEFFWLITQMRERGERTDYVYVMASQFPELERHAPRAPGHRRAIVLLVDDRDVVVRPDRKTANTIRTASKEEFAEEDAKENAEDAALRQRAASPKRRR